MLRLTPPPQTKNQLLTTNFSYGLTYVYKNPVFGNWTTIKFSYYVYFNE